MNIIMRKIIICFYVVVCLISCVDRKLQRQLEVLSARDIVVPNTMRQMVGGRDSTALDPTVGLVRLVVWVDSVGCSSCRLGYMFLYDEIIGHSKAAGDGFVPVFVFSPPKDKIEEVMVVLKYSEFTYPVLIDEKNLFSAANPNIPDDSRFHTFLLDKNGKVVLVGDPANNPTLWELYKKTIVQLIENGGTMPE